MSLIRPYRLVALVVLALMLAGCGGTRSPDVGGAPGTDPDQPVSDTLDPSDDVAGPAPSASPDQGEPRPGMVDVRPVPFEDVDVEDDGHTLVVTFWSGVEPCYVLDSVEVEASDEQVALTLLQGSDPDEPDAMCIEIAKLKQVEVALDEPLGDREVVDGSKA